MEFQFRWQLITNHSVLARSRNVQITGVAGLIHPCYIVNPYQTWNQTYSVWSRFQGIPSGVHNRKFNGIFALVREDCDDGMFCSETWLSSRNIECACDRREKTSFSFNFPWLSFQPILTLQRCTLTFRKWIIRCRSSCMMFRWRFYVLSPFMIIELKFDQFSFTRINKIDTSIVYPRGYIPIVSSYWLQIS